MAEVFAGIDLGGTGIKCALATREGEILIERSVPTDANRGEAAVLETMAETVNAMAEELGRRPVSVGIGVPGLVDIAAGMTKFLPNFRGHWRDVPVGPELSTRLGVPVTLLNDVRSATYGELVFGHGRAVDTMAFFALGTGVGGGIVVDGRLRLGPLGAAGELGHMTIVPDGPPCGCGSRGCVETIVGAPAIVSEGIRLMRIGLAPRLSQLVDGDITRITPQEMATAALEGDDDVREAIERAAGVLGLAVANVVTVLHPDLVVLGGGVAKMGELLFGPVRAVVREDVRMFPADDVRIEPSMLDERAGVLGAIALASRGLPGVSRPVV